MKRFFLYTAFLFVIVRAIVMLSGIVLVSLSNQVYAQSGKTYVTGNILNYQNQAIYIYKCYCDTLLFIDSVKTDSKGKFVFSFTDYRLPVTLNAAEGQNPNSDIGIYRFNLPHNQWFYILNDGKPISIKTVYQFSAFYNVATDSLVVLKSEENKNFYEFQHLQQKFNIANYWLLQMMRLYPLPDPFHKKIEDEYFSRYKAMEQFVKSSLRYFAKPSANSAVKKINTENLKFYTNSMATKIALAYFQPVNPDWKQPDPWRDSIIAAHYFDYFNLADSFYIHTNILPEKMDLYLALRTNKRDAFGQPVKDEMLYATAAQDFLDTVIAGQARTPVIARAKPEAILTFCLNYLLKKFNKEHKETAFLYLCDQYLKPKEGDCETEKNQFNWAREKAGKLRNIAIGSIAPDFELEKGKLSLSTLQSDYTLLLFWATWCSHCTQAVTEIKKAVEQYQNPNVTLIEPALSGSRNKGPNSKSFIVVAVSLDTDSIQWQKFVVENNLFSFLNFSELKGWKGEVSKLYNVYATPTMFLLDKDKKIIAKPITAEELKIVLTKLNSGN